MAASSSGNIRLKPKKPLDVWSTREKLCLASAVYKIGDQNWVSVSRAIKPYAEANRPSEWFHQKNCVLQYYDLLEQLEQPKRKRGGDKSESDTPSLQIMRRMTIERSEQLKKEIMEMQQNFKQLKSEVEAIKAGQWDDKIKDVYEEIKKEQRAAEEQVKVEVKVEDPDEDDLKTPTEGDISFIDDITQGSVREIGDISVLTDEEGIQPSGEPFSTSTPTASASSISDATNKLPTASHLLSSLLKSDVKTATGLQQLKLEQEQVQLQHSQPGQHSLLSQAQRSLLKIPVTQDDLLTTAPSGSAPTLSRLLSTAKGQTQVSSSVTVTAVTCSADSSVRTSSAIAGRSGFEDMTTASANESAAVKLITDTPQNGLPKESGEDSSLIPAVEGVEEEVVGNEDLLSKEAEELQEEDQAKDSTTDLDVEAMDSVKEEADKDSQDEEENTPLKRTTDAIASEAELTESSIKDEPLSPASSISSRISETGSKKGSRSRGRPRGARSMRLSTRKSYNTDDDRKDDGGSSRHSDVELSEDEARESDDLTGNLASVNASSILSESFPNSPASLSICSDTEEEKSFKQWKKSIMLVWRAAATHKYANVFLHPVTDDIAPGYRSVVLRPMDLSTIKKNVETGVIRTTAEFQKDMMLMFTNAIMYNSSDHNVFKMAKEMYDDVMQHIEQYVNTQMMIQTTDAKNLRQSRRPDILEKEEDPKKRRLSVDQSETGGKTKKRKTRLDETLP